MPTLNEDLIAVGLKLASESVMATESDIQSDIKMFLVLGNFGLKDTPVDVLLEAPAGNGCRIDVLSGRTVIEVKRRVDSPFTLKKDLDQLSGYIRSLNEVRQVHHVGVLADGKTWLLYQYDGIGLAEVSRYNHTATIDSVERLALWLEATMALSTRVPATPSELISRLGRDTPSYKLAIASLARVWAEGYGQPSVAIKRDLWRQMCYLIFGTSFTDEDQLFFDHTYLIAPSVKLVDAANYQLSLNYQRGTQCCMSTAKS